MELLTTELRRQLPTLGATAERDDALALVKFFTPDSSRTWYAAEFDGTDVFYGLVDGFEVEFGTFSLAELSSVRGTLGLPIERDLFFKPVPILELYRELGRHRRY